MALKSASSAGKRYRQVDVRLADRHPGQREVMASPARFKVLACGRRWGKTTLGIDDLVTEPGGILDGQPVAWFAPNSKLFNEVWHQAVDTLRPITTRVDSQQNRIDLVTGSHFDFWTLHNTDDPGRGRMYGRVFVDEAAIVPTHRLERQWNAAIRPTLTDLHGRAMFGSTPTGMNYYRDLWLRGTDPAFPDWASWQMPTTANPFIDSEEVGAAKRELPGIVFQQEYLAQFVDMAGARVKREWLRHGDAPDSLTNVVMGVDLAISTRDGADWTAAVVLARAPDGTTWVLAAERTRAAFHDVVNFVTAMAERYHPTVIAIEQVQYQAAVVQELLRKTNLPVKGVRPDKDKLTRFLPLEARYEQGLVWHARGLTQYEDELLSFPEGAHDDFVDAAAYAFAEMTKPVTDRAALKRAIGY